MSVNTSVNRWVKVLLFSLFLAFLLGAIYLLFNFKNKSSLNEHTSFKEQGEVVVQNNENIQWEPYLNPTYKYALVYPGTLTKNEYEDIGGGYLHFIRFEENELSRGKGVAVGVSERSLGDEAGFVREEILGSENGELFSERKVVLKSLNGIRLDFGPKEYALGEKRVVVVVNKSGMSYSISTVPEQIDMVLESFTLFD